MHIHCEMIITVQLVNVSPHTATIFVCVMSAHESVLAAYFHCSIQYYY